MLFKNKGWEKSTSPQISIRFKILPATEEFDQEIEFDQILDLAECYCHSEKDPCERCLSIFAIEEYFKCVGFDKLLKSIPAKESRQEGMLVVEGCMNWRGHYNTMDGDYYDDSQFVIDHYYYPSKF